MPSITASCSSFSLPFATVKINYMMFFKRVCMTRSRSACLCDAHVFAKGVSHQISRPSNAQLKPLSTNLLFKLALLIERHRLPRSSLFCRPSQSSRRSRSQEGRKRKVEDKAAHRDVPGVCSGRMPKT